jgi:hypothetical protein
LPRRAALLITAVLALAGCRRQTGPDANYEKASQIYQELYASELDDAYGDPKMDEVVILLKKVEPRSIDAATADALLGTIQRGREALAKQRAEREKLGAALEASAAKAIVNLDPERILAASAPDAGAGAVQDPYGTGASVADINAQSGGCLNAWEPFKEQVTNVSGTVYRLVPGPVCAGKVPGFVGMAVLVVNGKIYRRVADPNPPGPPAAPPQARPGAQTATTPPAAAPAPGAAPAAQPGAPAARPAPPPSAADGGTGDGGAPEYLMYAPGGPPPPDTTPPTGQQQ